MKIKRLFLVISFVFLFYLSTSISFAGTFSDNFNDGNADGWWLGSSIGQPSLFGNWRIENGTLAQDSGLDGVVALLENFQFMSQTIATDIKLNGPSGGGGITFWYQNNNTLAFVILSNGKITIAETEAGTWHSTDYSYSYNINDNNWVNLKINTNSANGEIDVYINENYILTHSLTTLHRTGQTGVIHGNAGGYFDNFSISANSIFDPLGSKEQCKNNQWKVYANPTFMNQGKCIQFLNTY